MMGLHHSPDLPLTESLLHTRMERWRAQATTSLVGCKYAGRANPVLVLVCFHPTMLSVTAENMGDFCLGIIILKKNPQAHLEVIEKR